MMSDDVMITIFSSQHAVMWNMDWARLQGKLKTRKTIPAQTIWLRYATTGVQFVNVKYERFIICLKNWKFWTP